MGTLISAIIATLTGGDQSKNENSNLTKKKSKPELVVHRPIEASQSAQFVVHEFIWKYGGKEIFLAGSFTNWQPTIAMVPCGPDREYWRALVELDVNRAWEFKFVVDGIWRCGLDLPTVTDPQDSSSESASLIPTPLNSPVPPRVYYQRPWCPGQVMASLIPQSREIIYDWRNPLTCQQFADNYGGVSVLVGELGGPEFCSAGPTLIYSNYTITRGMSINEPVYARVLQQQTGIEYAAAAGPIFYPEGRVFYISVAKEVAKLPQICVK